HAAHDHGPEIVTAAGVPGLQPAERAEHAIGHGRAALGLYAIEHGDDVAAPDVGDVDGADRVADQTEVVAALLDAAQVTALALEKWLADIAHPHPECAAAFAAGELLVSRVDAGADLAHRLHRQLACAGEAEWRVERGGGGELGQIGRQH